MTHEEMKKAVSEALGTQATENDIKTIETICGVMCCITDDERKEAARAYAEHRGDPFALTIIKKAETYRDWWLDEKTQNVNTRAWTEPLKELAAELIALNEPVGDKAARLILGPVDYIRAKMDFGKSLTFKDRQLVAKLLGTAKFDQLDLADLRDERDKCCNAVFMGSKEKVKETA